MLELELLIVLPWSWGALWAEPRADWRFGVLGNAVEVLMAVPGNLLLMLVSREAPLKLLKFWRFYRFYELFFMSYLMVCWVKCVALLWESRFPPFEASETALNLILWSWFLAVWRPPADLMCCPLIIPPPPCKIIRFPWFERSFSFATLSLPEVDVRSVPPEISFEFSCSLVLFELWGRIY